MGSSDDDLGIAERLQRGKNRFARSQSFGTKVTRAEEMELLIAANAAEKNASEWARDVLLKEARRVKEDAILTEVIATRMVLHQLLDWIAQKENIAPEVVDQWIDHVRENKRETARVVMEQYSHPNATKK